MSSKVLLPLCALALACGGGTPAGGEAPKIGRSKSKHVQPPADLPAEYTGQEPSLQNSAVLGLLPDNTMAAVLAKSPKSLAASTELTEIFREYAPFFAEANLPLGSSRAARLLEPETWGQLGIDADAPIGAAMVVEKRAVGLFFVGLSDARKFQENIPSMAAAVGLGDVHQSTLGERHVVRFKRGQGVALVVQAQAAILITADRSSDIDVVLPRLLGSTQAPTLAQSARVAKIFSGFDYGEDIAGFIAFDTIAAKIAMENARQSGDSYWGGQLEELEARVEVAKASGKPQTEIDELEARLAETLQEYNRYTVREAAEARFTNSVLGTLGTVAFGIDLAGAKSGLRMRAQPAPGSIGDRLFLTGAGPLALPRRLQEAPLALLAAHVNRDAALEVFTTLLNMDGKTKSDLAADVKRELHVDLDAALNVIGGEISGAFTLDAKKFASAATSGDIHNAVGMHVLLEVRDETDAKKVFNDALTSPALARYRFQDGDTIGLQIPGFNSRPIRITLSGRYFEMRSVTTASPSSQWHAHEEAIVGSAHNMALAVLDPMMLQWLMFADGGEYYYAVEKAVAASETPERDPKAVAQLKELDAAMKKLQEKRNLLFVHSALSSSAQLGRITVAARHEPNGSLSVFGLLVGKATNLGRGLQAIVESFESELEQMRTGTPSEAHKIQEELSTLREKRWELRDSFY